MSMRSTKRARQSREWQKKISVPPVPRPRPDITRQDGAEASPRSSCSVNAQGDPILLDFRVMRNLPADAMYTASQKLSRPDSRSAVACHHQTGRLSRSLGHRCRPGTAWREAVYHTVWPTPFPSSIIPHSHQTSKSQEVWDRLRAFTSSRETWTEARRTHHWRV